MSDATTTSKTATSSATPTIGTVVTPFISLRMDVSIVIPLLESPLASKSEMKDEAGAPEAKRNSMRYSGSKCLSNSAKSLEWTTRRLDVTNEGFICGSRTKSTTLSSRLCEPFWTRTTSPTLAMPSAL